MYTVQVSKRGKECAAASPRESRGEGRGIYRSHCGVIRVSRSRSKQAVAALSAYMLSGEMLLLSWTLSIQVSEDFLFRRAHSEVPACPHIAIESIESAVVIREHWNYGTRLFLSRDP